MADDLTDLERALQAAFLAAHDCLLAETTLVGHKGLDGLLAPPWEGFWTLTPWGAARLGLALHEHGEGNPRWDWADVPERPVVLVGEPGHRRLARPEFLRDRNAIDLNAVDCDHPVDDDGDPIFVNAWGQPTILFGRPAKLSGVSQRQRARRRA